MNPKDPHQDIALNKQILKKKESAKICNRKTKVT